MHCVHQGERFVVIDNFLSEEALARLREYAIITQHRDVDSVVDARIDGAALRSRGGVFGFADHVPDEGAGVAVGAIKDAVIAHPEIYGTAGSDWKALSFALWQYPAGTRLGWHNDAGNGRTGEFILYLHETWRPSWGGELILLDEFIPLDAEGLPESERFAAIEEIVADSHGTLTAIHPRPNRLVMVRAGTCHYINRVDGAAGSAMRRSLTGFASLPSPRPAVVDRAAHLEALLSGGSRQDSNELTINGG